MYHIFGFYKFKKLNNLKKNKILLEKLLKNHEIIGSIIISKEGVNGTISAKIDNILKFKKVFKQLFQIKKFNSENNSTSKFKPL